MQELAAKQMLAVQNCQMLLVELRTCGFCASLPQSACDYLMDCQDPTWFFWPWALGQHPVLNLAHQSSYPCNQSQGLHKSLRVCGNSQGLH